MRTILRAGRALALLERGPKITTTVQPKLLPFDVPIEEELLAGYHVGNFYPVNPGDLLKDRYEISAKLGYGACSTVWLGRDTRWYVDSQP